MTDYLNYLDAAVAGFQQEAQGLLSQDRADEANSKSMSAAFARLCMRHYSALRRPSNLSGCI